MEKLNTVEIASVGVSMTEDNNAPGFMGQVSGKGCKSINTDTISVDDNTINQDSGFNHLECISCNELGHTIPVWEDVTDWFEGESPDYIGCTNCHTMHSATDQIIEDHYNQ